MQVYFHTKTFFQDSQWIRVVSSQTNMYQNLPFSLKNRKDCKHTPHLFSSTWWSKDGFQSYNNMKKISICYGTSVRRTAGISLIRTKEQFWNPGNPEKFRFRRKRWFLITFQCFLELYIRIKNVINYTCCTRKNAFYNLSHHLLELFTELYI